MQPDVSVPPYATLRTDPFGTIAPYIDGLQALGQQGLAKIPEDASALSDFLQQALVARLTELGIEDEVHVRPLAPPLPSSVHSFKDCDTLGVAVLFGTRNAVHDGHPVVVVVVNTVLWQFRPTYESGKAAACTFEKMTELVSTNVFLVEQGDREKAFALSKDLILSIVDHAILYRLVLTNTNARDRVKSWVVQ